MLVFESDLVPPPLDPELPDLYEVIATKRTVAGAVAQLAAKRQLFSRRSATRWIADLRGQRRFAIARCAWNTFRSWIAKATRRRRTILTVTYASPIAPMARAVGHVRLYIAGGCLGCCCFWRFRLAVWGLRRSLRPLAELATSAARSRLPIGN